MKIYDTIPQESLHWLDRLTGKTGAPLPASAQTAPPDWLPAEVSTRLESGKTYVMTINDEVLAVTAPDQLTRGLEGTVPASHAAGSTLYQAFTAHQLQWLMRQAASSGGGADPVEPEEPEEPEEPDMETFQLTVGELFGGNGLYGAYRNDEGSLQPSVFNGTDEILGILWGENSDSLWLEIETKKHHPNGLLIDLDGARYRAWSTGPASWDDSVYVYAVRIAQRGYAQQEGDISPTALSQLPKSGTHEIQIGIASGGYQGASSADEISFKMYVGKYMSVAGYRAESTGYPRFGYLEPDFFEGHPTLDELMWSSSHQVWISFREGTAELPASIELSIGAESAVIEKSPSDPNGYFLYIDSGSSQSDRDFYESLDTTLGGNGPEYDVTIRFIRD